jgi:hypothetical protein
LSKSLKWAIVALTIAVVILVIYFSGELFGKTLGPLSTVILLAALAGVGWKWADAPPKKSDHNGGGDPPAEG